MAKQFTSVWTREARKPKASGLSREQIVRAAIELLDADGLEALSMRKLAAKLGSGTTSVYWYVANKDELLELALDDVWGLIRTPEQDADWRELIDVFAHSMRDVLRAHPWAASLLGKLPSLGPQAFALTDRLRRAMVQAGFDGIEVYLASGTVTCFVFGQVVPEIAWRASSEGKIDIDLLHEAAQTLAADYPELRADYEKTLAMDHEKARNDSFDFGLNCVLDGLAARLARGSRESG
ncbi:MAG: TetR/AcrR family transcriptional regulator [Mycobacteriaceae bacterium]|nr:TetR/AcrR family transcriptional regulator [Mycobacteriaceae bacterium]